MATFARSDNRNRIMERLLADLQAADAQATLQYFGRMVIRVEAPGLTGPQLLALLMAAKTRDPSLDFGGGV